MNVNFTEILYFYGRYFSKNITFAKTVIINFFLYLKLLFLNSSCGAIAVLKYCKFLIESKLFK